MAFGIDEFVYEVISKCNFHQQWFTGGKGREKFEIIRRWDSVICNVQSSRKHNFYPKLNKGH